jgi:hypothetical protein
MLSNLHRSKFNLAAVLCTSTTYVTGTTAIFPNAHTVILHISAQLHSNTLPTLTSALAKNSPVLVRYDINKPCLEGQTNTALLYSVSWQVRVQVSNPLTIHHFRNSDLPTEKRKKKKGLISLISDYYCRVTRVFASKQA